jgi:hypothetical protein
MGKGRGRDAEMSRQVIVAVVASIACALSVSAAEHALAGVIVTDVKPDPANMTITWSLTNGTTQDVTAWSVEITSINGEKLGWGGRSEDSAWTVDGGIAPGITRRFSANLHPISGAEGKQLPPISGDVLRHGVVFDDNTAFGEERWLRDVEQWRAKHLKVFEYELAIIDEAKNSGDPRAFIANLLKTLPDPEAEEPSIGVPRRGLTSDEVRQKMSQIMIRRFVDLLNENLKNGASRTDWIFDLLAQRPAAEKARFEGHVQLKRAQ